VLCGSWRTFRYAAAHHSCALAVSPPTSYSCVLPRRISRSCPTLRADLVCVPAPAPAPAPSPAPAPAHDPAPAFSFLLISLQRPRCCPWWPCSWSAASRPTSGRTPADCLQISPRLSHGGARGGAAGDFRFWGEGGGGGGGVWGGGGEGRGARKGGGGGGGGGGDIGGLDRFSSCWRTCGAVASPRPAAAFLLRSDVQQPHPRHRPPPRGARAAHPGCLAVLLSFVAAAATNPSTPDPDPELEPEPPSGVPAASGGAQS